ncbi:peptide deformylase [Candidatus Xianfuyuplasma coldseepsis]|uniref:Peptide deformylase n=1 Tax=Candidatus Xianfuyuplasma coldseepsis TaxID=2782163 RepID=A0A7L7KS21_9MOLU|nr:peptide deformylase [Xianfuyuplasma coldseepsis]QMS85517.1 peptide deformylase [Xianfuyuplasma coldseepsis]
MLLMKDIIREGHPTLAQRSEDVSIPLDDTTKTTLKEMMEFLENSQDPEIGEELGLRAGVGLAAPQINIKKRMIAILTTDEMNEKLYKLLLVNPTIISHSEALTYLPGGEGCLSVDREVTGLVPRYKKIRVRAYQYLPDTDELRKVVIKVQGYVGIVIQHEIDHLNGVLFVDKLEEMLPGVEPVVFPEVEEEEME